MSTNTTKKVTKLPIARDTKYRAFTNYRSKAVRRGSLYKHSRTIPINSNTTDFGIRSRCDSDLVVHMEQADVMRREDDLAFCSTFGT